MKEENSLQEQEPKEKPAIRIIKWVHTVACKDCFHWDRDEDKCANNTCIFKTKR